MLRQFGDITAGYFFAIVTAVSKRSKMPAMGRWLWCQQLSTSYVTISIIRWQEHTYCPNELLLGFVPGICQRAFELSSSLLQGNCNVLITDELRHYNQYHFLPFCSRGPWTKMHSCFHQFHGDWYSHKNQPSSHVEPSTGFLCPNAAAVVP